MKDEYLEAEKFKLYAQYKLEDFMGMKGFNVVEFLNEWAGSHDMSFGMIMEIPLTEKDEACGYPAARDALREFFGDKIYVWCGK